MNIVDGLIGQLKDEEHKDKEKPSRKAVKKMYILLHSYSQSLYITEVTFLSYLILILNQALLTV